MGHRNIDTLSVRAEAHENASELFKRANFFLSKEVAGSRGRRYRTETPEGSVIERFSDMLIVTTDFIDGNGKDYTVEVTFEPDIRELPNVAVDGRTLAMHKFPRILGDMIALIPEVDPQAR